MKLRNLCILLLTALIWGVAFVAQAEGGNMIGPYTFCCIRSILACFVLFPTVLIKNRIKSEHKRPKTREEKKLLLQGGILCGIFLSIATIFQQLGMFYGSEAGKTGFITACYIILVPIISIFVGEKCGKNVWLAVIISLLGLYLLCMTRSLTLQKSDILVLICSLMFSFHILTVDHYAPHVDVVAMSSIQFLVAAVISFFPTIFIDIMASKGGMNAWIQNFQTMDAWIWILYAGVMSSGIAYTLQNIGQKNMNPTIASLVLSLESVFSVIAGWIILNQHLSGRQITGCALIFVAVILAQFPV